MVFGLEMGEKRKRMKREEEGAYGLYHSCDLIKIPSHKTPVTINALIEQTSNTTR